MPLNPQIGSSGGGLYPATTQSRSAQPIANNLLQGVPAGTPATWALDSNGNVEGLVEPDGSILYMPAVIGPGDTARTVQDALNGGRAVVVAAGSTVAFDMPLLLGSDTSLEVQPGVQINGTGTLRHNFARTGNAEYVDSGIPGVWIVCATERSSYGVGTLTYTHSGTTLEWAAPGDVAGSPVSIASVTTPATSGLFRLVSANGDELNVVVIPAASRNAPVSRAVRVEPVTGARPITWVRNGTTFVATESAHGRRVGDIVMVFGTPRQHGYIIAADANTWTLADASGASSGSASAYGVRNINILATGSTINGNHSSLTGTTVSQSNHAWILFAATNVNMKAPAHTDYAKYCVLASGCANMGINGATALEGNCSDTVHITGPHRGVTVANTVSRAIDNIIGIGCCDYVDYNIFWPGAGTVDVSQVEILNTRGINTRLELVRIYNANSGWIRDAVISGVYGTFDASVTTCATSIISDLNVLQVDPGATNIDRLVVDDVTAVASVSTLFKPAFSATGTGTRRGVRIQNIPLLPCNANSSGTVVIDSAFQDIYFAPLDGVSGFSGPAINLRGSAVVELLTVELSSRLRGDNQLPVTLGSGTAQQPSLVQLEAGTSTANQLHVFGGAVDDISATGTKVCLVRNNGVIQAATVSRVRAIDFEMLWRQLGASNTGTVLKLAGIDYDSVTGSIVSLDAAMASIQADGLRISSGYSIVNTGIAAGTTRIDLSNVLAALSIAVLRNVLNGATYILSASSVTLTAGNIIRNEAGNPVITVAANNTSVPTPISIVAGTPVIRLGGSVSFPVDGTLIDATVTNHGAGASFYNTNAAFGAGVGAYVRGSATWTRVAA